MKDLILRNDTSNLVNKNALETINEIASTSAKAASTIAKHTNSDEKSAVLIGVGTSFLLTAFLNLIK